MKKWSILTVLASLANLISAAEVALSSKEADQQRCSGMYSKESWGGEVDPYILVTFEKQEGSDKMASLLMYEWKDLNLIGQTDPDHPEMRLWKCDEQTIARQLCNQTEIGEYLLAANATEKAKNPIATKGVPLSDPKPIKYEVKNTGYYCIATDPGTEGVEYKAVVEFRNAYGELAASQIAKLPFYGGITLVYAVMGIFWGFLYVQNRHDILPVQNYITAILIFLVVEMLLTWGYYDYENVHGSSVGTKAFMIIVAILNAARNSFSFFLLLIVCMGYGVVKPTLGKTMTYVRILAGAHFAFGVIYTIASMNIHPEDAGILVLLVILPLSSTLTAFYIWTLNSLNLTMKDLTERKQHVKAGMYRKLWWCILTTIVVIFGFFFFNSFTFVSVGNDDFAPTHWRTRWFVLDGWLNLVYLTDVAFIAYLWRPTPNNRRFAMSDEISQDDDGFEIRSMRDSLDDSDLEQGNSKITPPDSGPSSTGTHDGNLIPHAAATQHHRSVSPLPAPKPQRPASLPRASLDGETIFAVGEDDDKWSDDEDSEERKGLVGKH
ncbi:integral membrane protein [Microthyrium microscopicum]|uniref:Integral membrane protein n=1 Tax=Microthyrium microscopicum TaxID=703497 RepID=A0A6A6U181_9PEZI|nr:integral membrane protein [Microthyrium microscopicum]